MKKILIIMLVAFMALSFTSCRGYEDLNSAIYGTYSEIAKSNDSENTQEMFDSLYDFYIEDLQRSFYYRYDNRDGSPWSSGYLENKYPEKYVYEKDDRTIYIKSEDEVYIVPFSEEYLSKNSIDKSNIETLENSDLYKYKIVGFEPDEKDDDEIQSKVGLTIILKSYYIEEKYENCAECYSTVEIMYQPSSYEGDDGDYYIQGYFADMISEKDNLIKEENNLSNGFSKNRNYYKTEQEANASNERHIEANEEYKAQRDEKLRVEYENEQELANSIPQVGMTKDEVRKSLWGSPDKINKTTYSWGTTEQWIYDDKGYVYFEDDIVDAVSEN